MVTATLLDGQSGLPSPRSTKSFWHRDPSYVLLGRRSTPELPATADVVIVGSGITGAFAARELVAGGGSVVMLEAREACWGATGRVSFTRICVACGEFGEFELLLGCLLMLGFRMEAIASP